MQKSEGVLPAYLSVSSKQGVSVHRLHKPSGNLPPAAKGHHGCLFDLGVGGCVGRGGPGSQNFGGLILGCIDADFCKSILVGIGIRFEKEIEKMGHGKRLENENLDQGT